MTKKIRRHDLDWLRVLVFGLLIFYHAGMFFVPWGWHLKNNVLYEWLIWPMMFLNQWRLPILFVISGMGTYYALSFRDGNTFRWERLRRLGLPLLFGILVIVPPQVYFERIANQQFLGSYLDFYPAHAFTGGTYPKGNFTWHHLWFLPYLLTFSLVLSSLFVYLRKHPQHAFLQRLKSIISNPWGLLIFVIPLYFIEALVEPFFPVTHALYNDWFSILNYGTLFLYGFLLISLSESFWTSLDKFRKKALVIALVSFALFFILRNLEDNIYVHFTEALVKVLNFWSWILVIFAYAARYLNRPSSLLSYCNTAVYPFYILHQTITVGIAYYLMDLSLPFLPKFTILILGTFFLSWVLYEFVIRRVGFLRPLFGLKPKASPQVVQQNLSYSENP